ncbi:MAG: 4Fe-4S binding protein [Deltaproteobacteria bacterium]|nr:4Fe-4S binding protein [Deltaproteobacteria bacterium]
MARVCDLCGESGEPKCVASCPEEALSVAQNGVIVWEEDKCDRCLICVDECPQQAVAFDPLGERINICDLCGGEPECIKWCPEEAISLS